MLFSICEKAFGRIGKKLEKNKLPKGGKDSGVECDTKTPGCETMCIDSFFPISPGWVTKLIIVVIENCHDFRILSSTLVTLKKTFFWQLEIIVIALPMIIFATYVSHVQGKQLKTKLDKKKLTVALVENKGEEDNEACFNPQQVFPGPGPTNFSP